MNVINLQKKLADRHAALQEKYADLIGAPLDIHAKPTAREQACLREFQALYRSGHRPSLAGLYVVAVFDGEAKNWLQELGRKIYYSKPSRYHRLLPLLGKLAGEEVPFRPKPGWQPGQKPPALKR